MSVAVICPALDEEGSVGSVVEDVLRAGVAEIIVVDNGSTDQTAIVAAQAGATVIFEAVQGYGAACVAGARAAGADLLVFMDADGSFLADEIESLTQPITAGLADLVLGSRNVRHTQAILPHQRFGNWLANRLLTVLYGIRLTDLGPFRAIRRDDLLALGMSEMTYGWPIEMMILARQGGLRLLEVPVTYAPRLAGRSKVSGTLRGSAAAGYHIIRTIARCTRRREASVRIPYSGDGHG